MRAAAGFVKEKKRALVLYAVLAGTFAAVSYLYDIRMDAVEYALLLSLVWFVLSGAWDYLKFAGKYKRLSELEQKLDMGANEMSDMDMIIPDADTLIEEEYQKIITGLYESGIEAESAGRIARQEMMDYYGMWVHQIKTPIAAMHVLLQAAGECQTAGGQMEDSAGTPDLDPASMAQYMKEMKLELFKIEQYVEMALTYLRMEDMSSDLSFEICPLDSIIRQAVRKYSQMFILRKIRLAYAPVGIKVLTDEKWLVFVLEQILSNALKYTHSDGSISIYMEDHVPAGHAAGGCVSEKDMRTGPKEPKKKQCLVIEDTGIGIWPEDLPRVFEKGFTGYNGRTDKKSTGIGLYLCKSVMDKLRHQIWIESEAGKGTKVYLSLARDHIQYE